MDTWSYLSEGKSLTSMDEMDLHSDEFPRNTKSFNGFQQNIDFTDTNFTEMARKPMYSCSSGHEILTFREDESGSSISNALIESNSLNSSLIDLNIGRMADFTIGDRDKIPAVSDISAYLPAKRARTALLVKPFCQVYGCNKDLSSSKDYHKRHKVCDVHSKTSSVIVNGIQQRFCQQCSRFHLLSEFDDGKRSCRRRLAGHNERRRKSHIHGLTRKSYRSSQGFSGTSAENPRFLSPDAYTGGILYAEGGSELLNPNGDTSRKLFLQAQGTNDQYIIHDLPSSASARDDNGSSCKASAFEELSGVCLSSSSVASCCALSLLSSKSQESSSTGTVPSFRPSSSAYENEYPFENSFTGRHTQNRFCLYSTKPIASPHSAQMLFQEPEILDPYLSHSPGRGPTVDLIELSSHLRRIEQQRDSFNVVKQEDPTSPHYFHNGRG